VQDTLHALNTLFDVLLTTIRSLAPFAPFITDKIFGLLVPFIPQSLRGADHRSVHFCSFPSVRNQYFNEEVERRVSRMQKIVDLGRTARERRGIALKMPLKSLVVIHPDTDYLEDVQSLREYICRELNIHDLITTSNESDYDVQYSATADFPVLGKKLKLDAKKVFAALPKLSNEQVCQMVHDQSITVEGVQVDAKDLVIRRSLKKDKSTTLETNTDGDVLLILDLENSRDLRLEGLSREVIRQVQRLRKRLRKKMSLVLPDDMQIEYEVLTDPENIELEEAFVTHASSMSTVLRAPVQKKAVGNENEIILEEFQEVQGATFLLRFCSL
jgi:isoleucyl-tRNA synthetase